jgi:hypothetical protein
VQVTSTRFLPLLVSINDVQIGDKHVLDEFIDGIAVAYAMGPPYGQRLITWSDLSRMNVARRNLRRAALQNLEMALGRVRVDGQPPALMLSFGGLESSVLLVDAFWNDLQRSVPGDLVVGVPARDVVIFTGSESRPGLERARRAVDRVFFAGDQHLLTRELLAWRGGWVTFDPAVPSPPRPPVPRQRQPWTEPPPHLGAPWAEPPLFRPPGPRGSRRSPAPGERWPEEPPAEGWGPRAARRTRRPSGPPR